MTCCVGSSIVGLYQQVMLIICADMRFSLIEGQYPVLMICEPLSGLDESTAVQRHYCQICGIILCNSANDIKSCFMGSHSLLVMMNELGRNFCYYR